MDGIMGFTTIFAGNFEPKSWSFCNGQIIRITANPALFKLLGNTYGGDGRTTFALPDLRSRTVVGVGQGTGTNNYTLGQTNGGELNSITASQMPTHNHQLSVVIKPVAANTTSQPGPVGGVYASGSENLYSPTADSSFLPFNAALTLSNTGNGFPFSTLHPVLGVNYIICVNGTFPSRS